MKQNPSHLFNSFSHIWSSSALLVDVWHFIITSFCHYWSQWCKAYVVVCVSVAVEHLPDDNQISFWHQDCIGSTSDRRFFFQFSLEKMGYFSILPRNWQWKIYLGPSLYMIFPLSFPPILSFHFILLPPISSLHSSPLSSQTVVSANRSSK